MSHKQRSDLVVLARCQVNPAAESDWGCFGGCGISISLGAAFLMYHTSFCESASGTRNFGRVTCVHRRGL